MINGKMGTATVTRLTSQETELTLSLTAPPPPPLPCTVLLALPRPKMLRRTLQTLSAMGVKEIHLINSFRVEKSFWQSPFLKEQALRDQLILGLEQAKDTLLPEIHLHKRFKPFVEDELPELCTGKRCLVAHPGDGCLSGYNQSTQATVLAIGPEGGFIEYEIKKFNELGFKNLSLGPRILRVENAVPVLLAKLFP